jgi:hypothetical protein
VPGTASSIFGWLRKPPTGQLDHWNLLAIEKTAHVRNALSGPFRISAADLTTMRKFVYDTGLVGGRRPEMLQELLAEICVVQEDNEAIIGKLRLKMSNIKRIGPEFYEMVAEDDIHVLKERIVNIFKAFAIRPVALGMVKPAMAEIEGFVGTSEEPDDESSIMGRRAKYWSLRQAALHSQHWRLQRNKTSYVAAYHGALQSATKFEQSGNSTECAPKNSDSPSGWSESNTWKTMPKCHRARGHGSLIKDTSGQCAPCQSRRCNRSCTLGGTHVHPAER